MKHDRMQDLDLGRLRQADEPGSDGGGYSPLVPSRFRDVVSNSGGQNVLLGENARLWVVLIEEVKYPAQKSICSFSTYFDW